MPKTLLLADDSVTIQKVVGISFANEDVTLVTVDNGDDAILKAREVHPDVILADVVMPGKNGYEVCQTVKADPALAHVPVLLLTGTFEAFDEDRARSAGASGHVSKPFEAQTLVDQVKRLFAQAAAPAPAPPAAPAPAPVAQPLAAPAAIAQAPDPRATMIAPAPSAKAAAPDDTFDFFDADAGELTEDESAPLGADAGEVGFDLEFESSDNAFAFAEAGSDALTNHIAAHQTGGTAAETTTDPRSRLDVDGTNAGSLTSAAEAFLADQTVAAAPGSGGTETDFDFDFGTEADAANPATAAAESLVKVDPSDFAQATVLDPAGGAEFAVSTSDLAAPAAVPALDVPPSADLGGLIQPEQRTIAPISQLDPGEALERVAPLDLSGQEDVAAQPDLNTHPDFGEASIEPPMVAAIPLPEFDIEANAFPAAVLSDAGEDRSHAQVGTAAQSGMPPAMEQLGPELRAHLHETLEKIAWESFSDVTEKIVTQAVAKIEAIAWEVIPQMAEALVREEIRRMKTDPGGEKE